MLVAHRHGDDTATRHTPCIIPGRRHHPAATVHPGEAALAKLHTSGGKHGHGNAEALHRYWTAGEGLAKWSPTPHPWTSLYHHLRKYLPDGEAKRTASEWFHEVKGYWSGSDRNRVAHGKPPRGKKIGPG